MKTSIANLLRKDILYIFIASLFISIIIFYGYKIITHQYYRSDFVSFFSSVQILRDRPKELYDFTIQNKYQLKLLPKDLRELPGNHFYPFINPPFFLLPFLPLLNHAPQSAYSTMMISIIVIASICLLWLAKLFPASPKKTILIVLIALSYAPTFSTIYLTQSSFTSLLVFIATYYFLVNQKWFSTGLTASLLLYKPQLAIVLFLYLILQQKKRLIVGLITGAMMLLILSLILTQGNLFSLLSSLPEFTHQIGAGPKIRITWLGFFHQLSDFIPQLPYQLLTYIFSLGTIIWGIKSIHKIKPSSKHFPYVYSIIITTTLLASIHAHYQETVLLFIPLFAYLSKFSSLKLFLIIALGWITYLLSIFNPFFPQPLLFLPTMYLIVILFISTHHLIKISER